uniref:recombinase family protein n=1 Tax=Ruminococcus sp. TaxID=41978 RepID=UPI0025EB8881
PFGYDYDREKNTLIPNEKAEQVRQIYQLYLQGYSTTQLAGMFDVSGDQHISAILDRETYLGRIRFRGEVVEGCHEAIIDEDTWNRVRQERQRRSRGAVWDTSYLLTGLLVCGKCGAKMRYQKWGSGLKIYCYSQQKSKPSLIKDPDCDNMRYDAKEVEQAVFADVFEKTRSITANGNNRQEISAEEVLKRKYDTAAGKLKRLYELYARGGEEVLLETINEYKSQLAEISVAIENEKQIKAVETELAYKRGVLENLRGLWDEMTVVEKRRALRTCIERIVLTDEDIDIVYSV